MILSWMIYRMKHTRRATCLLRTRKCMLFTKAIQPSVVLVDIGSFELWKAKFHCKLTSPHDFTKWTRQRHELDLGSAEHHNLRKSPSRTPRKRNIIDKEIMLIRITLHTHFHTHIQRHTHTSTHVCSAHKRNSDNQAQEPGLKGRKKGFC